MSVEIEVKYASGTYGNKRDDSCIAVAGYLMQSAFCRVDGTLMLTRKDDGSIWIANKTLTAKQKEISNANSSGTNGWGKDNWYLQGLFCGVRAFTVTTDEDGSHSSLSSAKNITGQTKVTQEGWGTTSSDPSSHVITVTQGAYSAVKIADSISGVTHSSDGKSITLYFAGGITIGDSVTEEAVVDAIAITFTSDENPDIPKLFDYYPWNRRLSGAWASLNRDGSSQTSTGLFRRESGSWAPVLNNGDANGMRYDGSSWAKSPEGLGE